MSRSSLGKERTISPARWPSGIRHTFTLTDPAMAFFRRTAIWNSSKRPRQAIMEAAVVRFGPAVRRSTPTGWCWSMYAHLKPLSAKGSNPNDQDIRAALYIIESLSAASEPVYKRLDSVLQNGATTDEIRTVGIQSAPVVGGGWDFTLGISFDANLQVIRHQFLLSYEPAIAIGASDPRQLGGVDFNIQPVLYGLSEYWEVGPGENWLDNFRVYVHCGPSASISDYESLQKPARFQRHRGRLALRTFHSVRQHPVWGHAGRWKFRLWLGVQGQY